LLAILLFAFTARLATLATLYNTAHSGEVAYAELLYF